MKKTSKLLSLNSLSCSSMHSPTYQDDLKTGNGKIHGLRKPQLNVTWQGWNALEMTGGNPGSLTRSCLDGINERMMLSLEKIGDAGSLVPRWSAVQVFSISLDKSAWVKGYLLWSIPSHCWASCSCPCLWSIPTLGKAGQHHWRWRLGWEAAGWFLNQHLGLVAAFGMAQPGPAVDFSWACSEAQSAAKKRAAESLHLWDQISLR